MFGSKKYKEVIEQQKAMLTELEFKVTEQNQLYRALYEMLATGMPLSKDSKMRDYVREGYEGKAHEDGPQGGQEEGVPLPADQGDEEPRQVPQSEPFRHDARPRTPGSGRAMGRERRPW